MGIGSDPKQCYAIVLARNSDVTIRYGFHGIGLCRSDEPDCCRVLQAR